MELRSRSFVALYALLLLVALIAVGPFVLMMAAPRSALMTALMRSMMSSGALFVYVPLVLLAGWAGGRWLLLAPFRIWRLAVVGGIVAVTMATVWDLS